MLYLAVLWAGAWQAISYHFLNTQYLYPKKFQTIENIVPETLPMLAHCSWEKPMGFPITLTTSEAIATFTPKPTMLIAKN